MINNQRCVKCINDKTVKKITFDKNGLCNYCNTYDKYEQRLHNYDYLSRLFLKKIGSGGNYQYDVALGFSGGKDSTYVLYKLVYEYKLKVKTYTLDNGFLSQEAKEKINRIVKEFGVEHEYVKCDKTLLKEMYHYIVKKYLSPCIACSFLGYAVMINYASKINARVGIHGRSIYQMLRSFSDDVDDYFKPFILDGLSDDETSPEELFSNVLSKIDNLVDKKLAVAIKKNLLSDAYQKGFRPFISYFLYHPYNQREIINFLEKNTSWRVESEEEHFDCLIHNGALHLKNIVARRHHLMPEYSVMVREKILTRDEALKFLKMNDDIKKSKEELKMLCNYANLNYNWLILKAKIYSKRWW